HNHYHPRRIDACEATRFLDDAREKRRANRSPQVARAAIALTLGSSRQQSAGDIAETTSTPGQQQVDLLALHGIEKRFSGRGAPPATKGHQGSVRRSAAQATRESCQSSARADQHAAYVDRTRRRDLERHPESSERAGRVGEYIA